ncbi:MAG: hypothetical protein ABH954_00530 [Candidatus Omnitrophota bacterium]
MEKRIFVLVLSLLFINSLVFAETITLKSGKKYEGDIVEKTDKYIKIDIGVGMPVTYFLDEIESIDGQPPQTDLAAIKGVSGYDSTKGYHAFRDSLEQSIATKKQSDGEITHQEATDAFFDAFEALGKASGVKDAKGSFSGTISSSGMSSKDSRISQSPQRERASRPASGLAIYFPKNVYKVGEPAKGTQYIGGGIGGASKGMCFLILQKEGCEERIAMHHGFGKAGSTSLLLQAFTQPKCSSHQNPANSFKEPGRYIYILEAYTIEAIASVTDSLKQDLTFHRYEKFKPVRKKFKPLKSVRFEVKVVE